MNQKVPHNYGDFSIKYQDRKGDICYVNKNTNVDSIMAPKDIAFSDRLISKFHPDHAFFIGMCAGQKIHHVHDNVISINDHLISTKKTQIIEGES